MKSCVKIATVGVGRTGLTGCTTPVKTKRLRSLIDRKAVAVGSTRTNFYRVHLRHGVRISRNMDQKVGNGNEYEIEYKIYSQKMKE